MKKISLSILTALCIFCAPLSAYEWGGLLSNDLGVVAAKDTDTSIMDTIGISAWYNAPLGSDGSCYLSSEATFKYNIFSVAGENSGSGLFDIDLLKISKDIENGDGKISINAGRFSVVDSTAAAFSQNSDGVSVKYILPQIQVAGYVGYTGLLNALNTSMYATVEKQTKMYSLAYPYLPVSLSLDFPVLLGNQSLGLQLNGFIDCGDYKTNLYYANAVLSGPITNSVYYNLATSFGSADFDNLMNYTNLTVYAFPNEALTISGGVEYASGDQGPFDPFYGVSAKTAASASVSPILSGVILPKAGVTYTTADMCFDVGAKYLVSCLTSDIKGVGAELDAGFVYNIFSDLQLGLNVSKFIDTSDSNTDNFMATLNLALAF